MGEAREDQSWTLLELLDWTSGYFERAGIESPRLNAEMLLGKVTNLERIMLYANFDRRMTPEERDQYRELVKRRAARCPLQYLLGQCEFYGREFEVSPAVMVPRQETELVVEKCLEKFPDRGPETSVADIGTGSGVIAVTLACERSALRVAATDTSADALEVARRNADRHGVADRMSFTVGRLCSGMETGPVGGGPALDLLVSNPPYIPSARIEQLQPEVRDHEPREALDGGADGLGVIRELIAQAPEVLSPGGWLVLELGEDQAAAVRDMIGNVAALESESVETERDGTGCERVLAVRKESE